MSESVAIRYRAFLSYAHADASWARWLHHRLEHFVIDKKLQGRITLLGPVPKELSPIFRDRDDFSGGQSLTDATIAALDQSAALIVLCSTIAATRPTVNEEVRLFRSRNPGRPVVPAIIDGAFPDNFPASLRYDLSVDGDVDLNRPVTLLGADLRNSGDGKVIGLAKTVSGVVGITTDEIVRRAERVQRQRLRNWVIGLASFIVLLVGLVGWAELNRHIASRRYELAADAAIDLVIVESSLQYISQLQRGQPQPFSSILENETIDRIATGGGGCAAGSLPSRETGPESGKKFPIPGNHRNRMLMQRRELCANRN